MSTLHNDHRDILLAPVVSEKSYGLLDANKYTFLVHPSANKTEIKIAVEKVFGVKVTSVNTINRQGKARRTRSGIGRRKNTKRAIVRLAEGHRIDTIEGMAHGDRLHPLQKTFIAAAALQCGICTPGFLMASKALLDRNPNPSETEIRYWLAGNLCRCTGYDKIVQAVMQAASELREAAR